MTITSSVRQVVTSFLTEHPTLQGKVYLTSGSRTWQEQLDIILDPKRKANYTNIKARFLKHSKLTTLPTKRSALSTEQLAWWKTEIMKQAGKSPGFPHVGGMAQDVSVKLLSVAERQQLQQKLEKNGLRVLLEFVTGSTSKYGVTISISNVFHVYRSSQVLPHHKHHH